MVRKKFKKQQIAAGILSAVIIIAALTFYVWHQIESVRLGYEINRLEAQIQSIQEQVDTLEVQKAALLSPDRVDKIARQKLGMKPVRDDQIISDPAHRPDPFKKQ